MKDKRPTKRFAAPARAGRPLRPQQLLILAYAAAVIVWLVYVLVGSAVMLKPGWKRWSWTPCTTCRPAA